MGQYDLLTNFGICGYFQLNLPTGPVTAKKEQPHENFESYYPNHSGHGHIRRNQHAGSACRQRSSGHQPVQITNLWLLRKWAERATEAGFTVKVTDTDDMASVKKMASVPDRLQACHTASVGGYIVEGHVPLADVKKLLKTKPEIRGIAVPGMPAGSPGMEYGSERQAFKVVTFGGTGPETVFQSYPAQ